MLCLKVSADPSGGYRSALWREADQLGGETVELTAQTLPADLDAHLLPGELRNSAATDTVPAFVAQNEQSPEFSAIGDWLAGLVFRGSVGVAWDAESTGAQADLTFLDIDPPALQLLPWELMRRQEMRLFLDRRRVLVRGKRVTKPTHPDLLPIRLLVVEGADDDALGITQEIDGLISAIPSFAGGLDVRFLHKPDKRTLWDAFDSLNPHILHYTGHGEIDPETGSAALRLGDRWLTRDEILNAMPVVPRMVILNACRSADQLAGAQSISAAFLTRGAGAVIGMRGDIRGLAAGTFAIKLYQRLAAGDTVDKATAIARREVWGQFNADDKGRDWCLPSLTLKVDPADVLPVRCAQVVTQERREVITARLYEPARLFVDRVVERGQFVTAADPPAGPPRRMMLISGRNEVGKSMLVRWFRTRSALRAQRLRYVDFKAASRTGFLTALDIIRDTEDDLIPDADRELAYRRYDYDLSYLLEQHCLPPRPAPGQELPAVRTVIPPNADPAEFVERIFASFRSALAADGDRDPLLIVLDHVGSMTADDFRSRVYPLLVRPIAEGELPNVRLIVVLDDKQRRDYWPSDAPAWSELVVEPIGQEDFRGLARQLLLFMKRTPQLFDAKVVDAVAMNGLAKGENSIVMLNKVVRALAVLDAADSGG